MLTEKDYCDYDTCVALRELGFTLDMTEKVYERNLMTNRYETIPKPLLYEAQKWLMEEKKIAVFATYDKNTSKWFATVINMDSLETINMARCDLYEEALSEGILDAVEILKENETIHE